MASLQIFSQAFIRASILEFFSLDLLLQLLNTSESDSDSTHTALAPPPTVPQDSSSRLPRVRASNLPRSLLPSKAEIPLHLLNSHHNTPHDLHPLLRLLPLPLITLLELHMLRHPHLASLTVNILMANSVLFQDDIAKIMWALSYFQTGHAATYCQSLIDHDHLYGSSRFDTWEEFEKEFIREFMPEDERTQASLTLEGVSYFQGTASVDEYVNNFCALITMAGLNVEPVLYSMNPTAPTIKA
ncbi:hypothetical protein D9758_007609 [Tetrapyrgos nigripes]|uniref:Retrotransposon gag domain-containing protein n=1 Tax=Tetrapyrgos nigripes TaxID=182062 RepID=A0A8H5G7Z6_9AGAR|nr:hypothetical protein D9758_007609 [Tetrapyrgos nigripes]